MFDDVLVIQSFPRGLLPPTGLMPFGATEGTSFMMCFVSPENGESI